MAKSLGFFKGLFLIVGLLVTPLLFLAWILKYLDGFTGASDMSANTFFNWHIFIGSVTIFWVFFPASLLYHTGLSFKTAKLIHWVSLTAATIGFISTVIIAHVYHQAAGYEDFYSVHSWMGSLTVILFIVQFVFGVWFLLFGCAPNGIIASTRRYHILFGLALIVLAAGTLWTGLMEKQKFASCDDTSTNYCGVKTWANFISIWIGLFLIVFLSPWLLPAESGSDADMNIPLAERV
eukprot:TRINITY_DN305_c0_g2_i1.p1 TRINITY_DN305_c0_g2~~TRINITY_DN305_c0_g2_i1.p1  ORF type:complete len:236 (-),score=41.27 TRINITY_DN305_c0_g2_i1:96-803(-)